MQNSPTTHPSWCHPDHCESDGRTFVEHRGVPDKIEAPDADVITARTALLTADGELEYDLIHLVVDMSMVATESMAEVFLAASQARELAATLLDYADAMDRNGGRS